jgi:hypothetical protein
MPLSPAPSRQLAALLAIIACTLIPACAGPSSSATRAPDQVHPAAEAYPLAVCGMCGTRLGARGDSVEIIHDGRPLRFCSHSCRIVFDSNPAAGLARFDALMLDDQRPYYPARTSLVTGRPLPQDAVEFIWGNRMFVAADARERACIEADPQRYLRILDQRILDAQRPVYGMPNKCPVQGDILEGDPVIDIVVASRMVRLCCMRCVRMVRARPMNYLPMIDHANHEAARRRAADTVPEH